MGKTTSSKVGGFVRDFFFKEEAPVQPAAAASRKEDSPAQTGPEVDMEFAPPDPTPLPSPRTWSDLEPDPEPKPTEEELRKRILGSIPLEDDEPAVRRTEKVMAVCATLQNIQYQETTHPLVQAGLGLALDHWADIHMRLKEGRPVEVEEARRAALAIHETLAHAPNCHWQLTRKINEEHLIELQGAEDGLIQDGPTKEACLEGIGFIVGEFDEEKKMHALFRKEVDGLLPGEIPDPVEDIDKSLAQKASQELLDNPEIPGTPPGRREPARGLEAEADPVP